VPQVGITPSAFPSSRRLNLASSGLLIQLQHRLKAAWGHFQTRPIAFMRFFALGLPSKAVLLREMSTAIALGQHILADRADAFAWR